MTPREATRQGKPAAPAIDPPVRSASLEGFGARLEALHGSSLWVAFSLAREISTAITPRQWGLFLRLGDDPVFHNVSGIGFGLPAGGGLALPRDLIETWPISHRVEESSIEVMKRSLATADTLRSNTFDALRFGDRSLFLSDRPIEPRPSGTLEAAFAAFGARLDPLLGRFVGKPERPSCSAAELGNDLSRKMRRLGASHIVLASFDITGVRESMTRDSFADPASFISLVARVASSLLAETGGACASSGPRLTVYILTRSPPDPELLAAQFATSLSRAMGGFDRTDLPILGFHSVRSDERGFEGTLEAFLSTPQPRP